MATIIKKNDKMSGAGRLTGKFIVRPVVAVQPRVYNGPSAEGAREYNSLKREFNSLFVGFGSKSLKQLDAFDRVLRQADYIRAGARRVLVNKIATPGKSWAEVVLKGPHNEKPIVRLVSKTPNQPWSRNHARRDYTQAFLHMTKERAAARLIVEGMAARRPRKVFPKQQEHIKLVDRVALKAALQLFRRERKQMSRPKEVDSFDFRCYQEVDKVEKQVPRIQEPCYFTWGIKSTSVKQIKKQSSRLEHDQGCEETRFEFKPNRSERRSILISQLSRTALGQYIVAVLLKREADKTGSSVEEAVDKLKVAFETKVEEPEPQMDPEGAIGQTANSESKLSNTVIDSLNPVDKGLTLGSMNGFRDLSISKESQIFSTMVDRWILLGDMEWSSETSHGAYLKFPFANNQTSLNIPGDIIKNNKNSPNAQLFLTHRWARYDVRLRFALNSNPFQVGSCVPSVIYKSSGEYSKAWENIYSALQRNHCKLNAGTSNDAELVIPYRHVNSMTCLKNRENIAQVSVAVLNKLITAGNTAKQCSITVYATFENVEFSGLISRSLGEENVTPQMDSIANVMNAGSDLIRTIRGDANRDNPPLSIQPVSLIPQAMPSFAYTDGVVDPVNMLRADSRGQTPHADMRDEMDPHEIARKWGYVKTVDWLVTDPYGKELYSVGVCPLLEQKEYETSVTVDNLESKVYPPIAFITSLYGKWRGDLEYKFEIFGSKFHTGRLIIGSVPFPEDKAVGISDLKYSAYKIFDLADSTEFIFRAPWHWRNSNVSTYSAGKPIQPSKLFVMVVNKLIAIENVAPQVYINIYVRAAENFELFIPRPSVLAPRFSDVIVPPSTEYLHPYNFEDKVWTDWRGVLKMANGNYAMTINIDSVANGWAGFLDAKEGEYYELAPKTTKDKYIRIPYYADENGTLRYVKWAAYDPSLSTANAHGLVLCTSEVTAQKFAVAVIAKMDLTIARQNCCFVWYKQGPVSQVSSDGKNWNDAINVTGDTPVWIIHKQDVKEQDGFELIEPQSDPVPVTSLERPTILSNGGLTIYGERTPDLKSLCRRYTHFGTIQALACIKGNPRDCPYAAKLNVSPMRHVNPETSFSYDNRWRNGTVTTIGSMYRLWRGSLRFRFVVVGSPPEGTTLYVQHRFDLTGSVRKAIEPGPKKVRTRDDLMNTQYATFAQALDVNSTCTVEVPYYSEKEGLSVMPKAPADWTQNGVLLIWVHSKVEANVHLEVFYSFADDCRFSVFQGCPAAIDINTIAPEPQMETESVEANGLFESVKRAVSAPTKAVETIESVKETSESLTRTSNKLLRILDSLSESKDKIFKKKKTIKQMAAERVLSYIGDEIIDTGSKFFEVATHLIYAVLSPTKKVIAWAIFNIYKKLFGMTFDGVHLLTKHISDLYEKMKYSTQRPQREEVEAQGDGTVSSYASLLFTSIATLCRLKASPPTSWKGIADGLFSFSNAARSGSFVSQFVQDNLEFFRRVYEKFLGLFGVKSSNYKLIAGLEDERLKNWLTSSDIILSAQYEEKLITDPSWSQKAFELGVIGRALERTLSLDPITPTRLLQLVRANVVGLKKIEKKLISRKVFSGARYTPSCIWVAGPAGTGKTHLLQDLAVELARFHQYRGVQTYHTMSAGVKYFDAYIGQPMIIIDDFLSGEITGSSEIGTQFLQMKSCNVFNMPKAAVEDKDQLLNFSDLGITSNYPFVDGLPGIHDRDAYNRRRDIVLHFEFNDPTLTPDNLKQRYPTDEPLIRMEHLNVYYYEEPTNTHSAKIQIQPENGDLGATVRAWCMERLRAYHTREAEGYARRCRNIQQALEEVDGEGSFEEVYRRYESSIKKFKEMILLNPNSLFRDWIRDAKDASTSSNLPAPAEAQAPESPFGWPYDRDERCGPLSSKTVIEPFDRENLPPIEPKLLEERCLHEIFDFKYANYDKDLNVFYSDRQSFPDSDRVNNLAMSAPGSCCKRSVGNDDVEDVPYCAWNDKVKRNKFLRCYIYSPMVKDDIMKKIDVARHARDWSILDEECPSVVAYLKDVFGGPSKAEPNSKVISMIAKEQIRLATEHQIIGEVVVPKKPKWKTFLANVWSVLLNVLVTIQSIIAILVGGIFLFSIFQFMTSPAPAIADPNMHPSGDFKTIRSAKTVKARSIRLLDGQGNEVSGSEEDILSSVSQKKNNSGIYRKIVNNSFFLVGKVPIPDTNKFLLYKSRCLGLYNKKFICLEHYIKYFKSVGVERVVVIYHEGKGMIEYDLKDIKFTWTSEGYGVGELPKSAPRQFSDITKYMPSERFDMAYPRRLKIFEIWNESVVEHLVEASLLSKPIVVNGTSAEGSWTISQGFQYAWGGKGCCGSVVIAEDMACPLVGIHTAGVGDKKGFAELLFRETFEDEAEVVLEYVTPNMDRTDSIYGLEGSYYEVGQLSADMAVRGSDKTRIEPSEIQGVFPVMTEPAPLTSKDPRLEGPQDILKIGASKRCDPPKEFPPEFTRTAFLSYWNLIKTEVKPIRAETGVLSMTQAIEGFLLPGYDPIVMSTSEGYPWVNMRPKGYSDKSWMFQRDSYPDGRMKILGVDPDLKTIFDLKESMRSRGVVPSSYFTCCLKDARILKEKVSIPGKTRVFEACPIDLTIAYRQYNLDFTASFSAARLRAENSIGINPDGPEWTELANWLLDFSPYIITADYSAFGPRLNHTVLENAFNITTEWYALHEECDEDEKDRRYLTREVLREEIVHALTIAKDLVFIPTCGMPSGFPDTVTKNSESNSQYIRIAFLALARKHQPCYSDLWWFTKLVRLVTNGDDLIAAIKPEIISWFNNETIIEFFAQYDIKMTDALKNGIVRPYCSLEEATYLKRGFLKHPTREGQWLAPLEQTSITDAANWIWRSVDRRGASLTNSEMSCRLAYSSGPKLYNQVCTTIAKRWAQEGVNFVYPPWILLDNHVWDNAPGPLFSF